MCISSHAMHKFAWINLLGLMMFLLVACGHGSSTSSIRTSSVTPTIGRLEQTSVQAAGQITKFSIPTADGLPMAITSGPDNNLWFTQSQISSDQSQQASQGSIGRITLRGKVTKYPLLTINTFPMSITIGPDDNLWFTEAASYVGGPPATPYIGKIGYITTGGKMNEFLLSAANSDPLMITNGPDGNLWFTDSGTGQIGRMSPHGQLTEFSLPEAHSYPIGIATGSDGNLWFTESGGKIGRITPAGIIKEFSIPTANSLPAMITNGPDGNLWFTETSWNGPNISSKIGRITPTGTITSFLLPNAQGYSQGGGGYLYDIGFGPISIVRGSDGNLWFTGIFKKNMIGRIAPRGTVTEFFAPGSNSVSYGISSGADGNLWFTNSGSNSSQIGRITTGKYSLRVTCLDSFISTEVERI